MNKKELLKRYQEIVLTTKGGNDDYVVALCQIGSAIAELDDTQIENTNVRKDTDATNSKL